jgi:hypothetical protein
VTDGDDEKDSSAAAAKENAPVTLGGSVQGGEVFLAMDDGFGVDLEGPLRASAYVIGKSHGGIVYRVISVHGAAVVVRRLSEPYNGDGAGGATAAAARLRPRLRAPPQRRLPLRLSDAPAVYVVVAYSLLRRGATRRKDVHHGRIRRGERTRPEGRSDPLSLVSTLGCGDCWRHYSSTPPR